MSADRSPESPFLGHAGEPLELASNRPLHLSPGGTAWWIESGTVEVFAVQTERGGVDGPRTHLATLEKGEVLFGVGEGGHRLALVGVGHPGTRLRPLHDAAGGGRVPGRIVDAGDEAGTALLAALDRWLEKLVVEIPRPPEPKHPEVLEPGSEVAVDPERSAETVRAGSAGVWGRPEAGRCHLWEQEHLPLEEGELVPLPRGCWVLCLPGGRIAGVTTPQALRTSPEVLEKAHHRFMRQVRHGLEESSDSERRRLAKREELDRGTMRTAYARLVSVLEPTAGPDVEAEDRRDPVVAACRLVGEHLGVEIQVPRAGEATKKKNRLALIASASRLRSRQVLLRGEWWKRDNGPLVGFRVIPAADEDGDDEHRPVALLPTSPRSYDLVDAVTRERLPVDAELASELTGEARMFYPPLPERPLTAKDLLAATVKAGRKDLTMVMLMGAGGGILALLVPILTGKIFGEVIPGADRGQLLQMTLALVVGALAAAIFQITRSIAVLRLSGRVDGRVQAAVWDRLLALPVSFFRRFSVGDLTTRSLGVDRIRDMLTGNVLTSVLAAVFSIFSFLLLFYYSMYLALVASGLVLLLMAATGLVTWMQLRHQRRVHHLQGRLASLLLGALQGISKLKVGGAEKRVYGLWAERFAEQRQASIRARRMANAQTGFNAVYGILSPLVIFAFVGLSTRLDLSVGDFLAFNAAFVQFTTAALSMVGVFSSLLTIVPVYERLQPILEARPEVDSSKTEAGDLSGDLEFSHVSFRYQEDGPLILDDVSLRARPGEFIALVGPSGSGKSTCLRLILGFEEPESGSIYFDGQDLSSLSGESVRRQIGVVLQNGQPMVGDIFSNIVGSSNLTLEDAWEAAEMAGLVDDIRDMPMGMHTVVSEGAGTFSGGQKQRLLIARAIVRRPRILLFDEATSALDNRTQDIVSRSLEALKATRVVVAHRLSTIQNADCIYVIDAGRVVESGTHRELLEQRGLFYRLAERQIA